MKYKSSLYLKNGICLAVVIDMIKRILTLFITLGLVYSPYNGVFAADPPPDVMSTRYNNLPTYTYTDILGADNRAVPFIQQVLAEQNPAAKIEHLIKIQARADASSWGSTNSIRALRNLLDITAWEKNPGRPLRLKPFTNENSVEFQQYLVKAVQALRTDALKQLHQIQVDYAQSRVGIVSNLLSKIRSPRVQLKINKIPTSSRYWTQQTRQAVVQTASAAKDGVARFFDKSNRERAMAKGKDIFWDMNVFAFTFIAGTALLYIATQILYEEGNPQRLKEYWDMVKDPAMYAAIAPFYVALRVMRGKSAFAAYKEFRSQVDALNGARQLSTKLLIGRSFAMNILAVGMAAFAGRFTHDIVDKNWSCIKLNNLSNYETQRERQELIAKCNATYEHWKTTDFARELTASIGSSVGSTIIFTAGVPILKNIATRLVTFSKAEEIFGMQRGTMNLARAAAMLEDLKAGSKVAQVIRIGVEKSVPVFRVGRFLGGQSIMFAVFVGLMMHVTGPPIEYAINKEVLLNEIASARGKVDQFMDNCVLGKNVRGIDCSLEKYKANLDFFQDRMSKWRDVLLTPASNALQSWNEYFAAVLQNYNASKNFYGDVIWQLSEQQKRFNSFNPQPTKGNTVLHFFNANTVLHFFNAMIKYASPSSSQAPMFTELPLFRADPLFGIAPNYLDVGVYRAVNLRARLAQGFDPSLNEDEIRRQKQSLLDNVGVFDKLLAEKFKTVPAAKMKILGAVAEKIRFSLKLQKDNPKAKTGDWIRYEIPVAIQPPSPNEGTSESGTAPEVVFETAQASFQIMNEAMIKDLDKIATYIENGAPKLIAEALVAIYNGRVYNYDQCQDVESILTRNVCAYERIYQNLVSPEQQIAELARGMADEDHWGTDVTPQSPGSSYLRLYSTYLREALQISDDYFPRKFIGKKVKSLSHYMLMSMMCDRYEGGDKSLFEETFGYSLEFKPPRITKQEANFCRNGSYDPMEFATQQSHFEIDPNRAFLISRDIWNVIPDREHPNGYYLGAAEYLAKNIDQEILKSDFKTWWHQNVEIEYLRLIDMARATFQDHIMKNLVVPIINRNSTSDAAFSPMQVPFGIMGTLTYERDYYFGNIIHPIFNTFAQIQKVNPTSYNRVRTELDALIVKNMQLFSNGSADYDHKAALALSDELTNKLEELKYAVGVAKYKPEDYPNVTPIQIKEGSNSYQVLNQAIERLSAVISGLKTFAMFWNLLDIRDRSSLAEKFKPTNIAPTNIEKSQAIDWDNAAIQPTM